MSYQSYYTDELDRKLLVKVKAELFDDRIIQVKEDMEGMRAENNTYFIGPWAGPQSHIINVFHEMAHFAERPLKVLKTYPGIAWGFTFGQYWEVAGKSGYEPQTDQSVRCEQRCWAYQLSIQDHFQVPQSDLETISSAVYLGAWWFYQPFGERVSKDSLKLQAFAQETRQMANTTHTWEKFIAAWNERIQALLRMRERAA